MSTWEQSQLCGWSHTWIIKQNAKADLRFKLTCMCNTAVVQAHLFPISEQLYRESSGSDDQRNLLQITLLKLLVYIFISLLYVMSSRLTADIIWPETLSFPFKNHEIRPSAKLPLDTVSNFLNQVIRCWPRAPQKAFGSWQLNLYSSSYELNSERNFSPCNGVNVDEEKFRRRLLCWQLSLHKNNPFFIIR